MLGHFGDKLGRKKILLLTLLIMGLSSLAIGFLPTYEQIGIAAPILLVLCRLAQGFSAGGEAAGASTLTLEHSPEGRRAFFTSFTMTGYAAGMVLATLVFIPVAALPKDQLDSWGWRIPFWCSAVMLVVTYFVRTKLDETPVFEESREHAEVQKLPVVTVVTTQWRDVLRIALCSLFAVGRRCSRSSGSPTPPDPTSASTAPRCCGRRRCRSRAPSSRSRCSPSCRTASDAAPVWITGALGCAVTIFGYFWAISVGSIPLIFVAALLTMTLFYSMVNGLWPSFFTEMFAAPVRYSGFAVGTQIGFLIAGFAPAIGWALLAPG